MLKAGIAIDNWKFPIFERHLKQNGYEFKQSNGLTQCTMLLTVVTENLEALAEVVKSANEEAAKTGEHL